MSDRRVFTIVVVFLGVALLTFGTGIIALAVQERPIPTILENLCVGCLTGLAGLLARGPSSDPQPVHVVNAPESPVPVEETP